MARVCCAAPGVLEHAIDLFAGDARKPLQKLFNRSPALQIFEECGNGHAGLAKYPGATHTLRVPFHCLTRRPIDDT